MLSFKQDWNPKVDIPALFCNSPWTSATTKSCNFSIFCIKFRFVFRIWHEHFFTVFSCYMYCVDLYVSKTFVYVYLCCYSQKRFIIWKENQIILSCALLQSRRRCWVPRPTHKRELAEADATVIDCATYMVARKFWKLLPKIRYFRDCFDRGPASDSMGIFAFSLKSDSKVALLLLDAEHCSQ